MWFLCKKPDMHLVVCGTETSKKELLAHELSEGLILEWTEDPAVAARLQADGFVDLCFESDLQRIKEWSKIKDRPVLLSSVTATLTGFPPNMIRFNGWHGFLGRKIIEASASEKNKSIGAEIFSHFHRAVEWIPDVVGFVSARVICMIINEAFFALAEKLSTREEIDIAMKLGTNYPYGPFEWCERIGAKHVYELLAELARSEPRYQPAPLLQVEARNT